MLKHIIIQFCLAACLIQVGAQVNSHHKDQQQVDSLLERGLFLSAFERLSVRENAEMDAELLALKVDLALNYYLFSVKHQQFSFIDLREGETLEELRKEPAGNGATLYRFPIDSVIIARIKKEPDNYLWQRLLGEYYFKIYLDFGRRSDISSEELLEKSKHYFLEAYRHGETSETSLYALGYYHTIFENYHEAQQWFLLSLRKNPNNPLTAYNLAVSYLFDGMFNEGVKYASQAYEIYTDSLKKGDAARITGILLFNSQDFEKALHFFRRANDLSPGYRPNQLYLLRSLLQMNNEEEAYELALEVLLPSLHDPDIPDEYVELFRQQQKVELLVRIFDHVLETYPGDYEALGNIRFHYGKLLYKEGSKRKALKMFKKSRQEFEQVFTADHPVFQALDQMIEQLS